MLLIFDYWIIVCYKQIHDSVVSPLYWAVKDGKVEMARVLYLKFVQNLHHFVNI